MRLKLSYLFFLVLGLISLPVVSAAATSPEMTGRTSTYYYFELILKEKITLIFLADKICPNNTDKISIDEFESTRSYPSTEGVGKVPVRIKSIYVESFSPCSGHPIGKIRKKLTIGPFAKQMTHIRLTTSDGIHVVQEK